MLKKIVTILCISVLIMSTTFIRVSASSQSYSRVDVPGGVTELRMSREMYKAAYEINADMLGLEKSLEGITDIFSCNSGKILVLCGESSRLLRLNDDYTLDCELFVTDESGEEISFSGATSVFCDSNNIIYLADTLNARILLIEQTGKIIDKLDTPVSDLIPEDFVYQPISIAKDDQGYLYILSMGCYYGALMYSPENEFMGFYGSNTVESNALDTLSYLWDKITSNDAKKEASVKKLPYSFSDFCFDKKGYMITSTGSISTTVYSERGVGQIKKISHNGSNILFKRNLDGSSVSSSAVDFLESNRAEGAGVQDIVSIAVSDDDYIFALDKTNGTVYIYDSFCNLMAAFGGGFGGGKRLGEFEKPIALTIHNNDVLVADSESQSVTLFKPTEYGTLFREAQSSYLKGDYEQSKILWQQVLSLNRNCQLAYKGLAMAYYGEGDFEKALETARIAVDYSVYDLAWQEIIKEKMADSFGWIIVVAVLIIFVIVFVIIYFKKHNKLLINNKKLKLLISVPFHPFNSFDDLKYKKMGSLWLAIGITILFYIGSVLNVISSGFLFSNTLLRNYNAIYTLIGTVGILLLWSVCNWLVCSMFSGKGKFTDVYISTCYALLPYIIFIFIKTIASNFMPLSGSGLIATVETSVLIFTFFLISVAMMKIHEYDFFKFLLTGIVIVFFMILVVFVIFMCAILITQCWTFIVSVYEEVAYR